ncbi:K02A2.6-like [Cordylochernes scorpioides]|uniref:RNA-directed DNA polymerase n=1 Tax=Cordylochernes scorpioides TaxID=51811 RepID=A0ABY6JVR1_9ARAC|nr:K02A2.6-like [Cordylochernes scorpioides]
MASYQFKEYNEETETFETFYERLEQFLILEEAGDEKKKAYLLTLMGKSISDYLVEIKRLASSCNFGNFLEDSLRDKMVCGLYNAKIQNRILSEGDISLAKVIEIALSMEAAEKNTKLFHLEQGEDCVDKLRIERKVESNFQNGKCKHCGKPHKEPCRFKEAICFKCNKKGHIASICWSSRRNLRQHQNQPGNIHQIGDQEEEEEYVQKIISVTIPEYKINFASSDPPYLMELKVEGNFIKFEMDTGSGLTLISEKDFKNSLQHLKLEKASIIVRTYDGTVVPILGKINVKVECQDITYKLRALVVKGEKRALMGREWINRLKLGCFAVKHMPVEITIEEILKENQALFVETTEPIKGFTFSVNMCDVNPIFHKARPVPFAIRPAVTEALDKMVAKGYLCEVASSKWATPVVVVPKKNKEIRICCDFKVTLNKYLDTAAYPLPTQQDLFSTLAKGKYFSKLDLRNAYLQLEVDPGTRPLLTINTHKGLFRFKRMPFGLANAPSYFQSVMDRVLSGIGGVICYIDDVLIATASIEEHLALLKTIFARLAKYNIKLKKEKCLFLQKEIEYLGHLVTGEGIRPLDHKVQAIQKAKTPTNISELRSFLGLVNFYGKFIPNLPELLKPLHELLHKKRPWVWTKECGEAIDKCKNSITSERVLVPYDTTLPLCLATDVSQIGVGAVLSHIIEGQERPIMFASRTLSEAEQNYSQIEKEALAIIYGVTKFHQFIYGKKFILITDHKPLVTILGSRSGIPTLSTSRLQRWALILSAYTYDIKFRRTQDHGNADLLSRFPVGCEEIPRLNNVYALSFVEELPITAEEIATETEKDEVLSLAKFYTQQGWPEKVADHLRPYFQRKLELTVDGECLVWGMRVVIPPSLRIKMLNCLHETHSGMNKMKAVARSHFWWPNLDTQIEFLVNKCRSCQQSQDGPNKGKWQPWKWSTRPWQRIHIDFANKENINLLIVVDSHSKWIEAIPMRETTTRKTIEQLRRLFSSYGLPEELVSDNGPQFTGSEMKGFLEGNGIKQTLIPAYHPQSNGLAERAVRTIKTALDKNKRKIGDTHTIQDTLSKVLLAYRSTPHVPTGKTPSELFIGRALRTRVSLIHPSLASRVRDQQARQMKYDRRTHLEEFQIDDLVWCKNFRGGDKWIPGKIVGKKGTRVYTILIHGQVKAYHRDQIRKRWRNGEEDESGDGERQPEHSRGAGPSAIISEVVRDRGYMESMSPGLTSQRSDQDSEVQSDTDDGKSLEPLRSLDPEALKEEGPVLRRNPPRARRPPEPVKVDRMTENNNMQRMTEAEDEYFADALTNMQPHCDELVSRLTDAIRGIAVPRVEEALISPFDGSYAANNFIQQLERTSEGPQDDATLQARLRALLKVEALTEGLQANDQRLMRAIAPKTLTEWYSTMTRIKGTSSLPTPSEPFQGVSNTSAFHRDTGTPSRGRNYNPFSPNNYPRYPSGSRRPPSPCKYCQGENWNNECSMNRRPYRQQAYHGQPTAHYFPPEQNGAHNLPVPAPRTNSDKIIALRPYRTSLSDQREIQEQVGKMLEYDIIEPSFSPYSSPVTLVTKKDKTKRFCVDYRRLNEIIFPDVHPLPLIENILDKLANAKIYSRADFSSAYWSIEISPPDRNLLSFATLEGQYNFKRLPYGIKIGPQGIAGILKQQHPDGTLHPVQYYSRALRPHEKNYTITELECLAVIDSVEKFRIYLAGVRFTIFTDHHALQCSVLPMEASSLLRPSCERIISKFNGKQLAGGKEPLLVKFADGSSKKKAAASYKIKETQLWQEEQCVQPMGAPVQFEDSVAAVVAAASQNGLLQAATPLLGSSPSPAPPTPYQKALSPVAALPTASGPWFQSHYFWQPTAVQQMIAAPIDPNALHYGAYVSELSAHLSQLQLSTNSPTYLTSYPTPTPAASLYPTPQFIPQYYCEEPTLSCPWVVLWRELQRFQIVALLGVNTWNANTLRNLPLKKNLLWRHLDVNNDVNKSELLAARGSGQGRLHDPDHAKSATKKGCVQAPGIPLNSSRPRAAPRPSKVHECQTTRQKQATFRARSAAGQADQCVYLEFCPDFTQEEYFQALETKLGKGTIYQLTKMEGHILVGLSSVQLADKLIEEGLNIEEVTLRAFPLRKRAERIVLGNVLFFVEDSDLVTALRPYGQVTSIIQKMMQLEDSCWADARWEAFITLRDGVKPFQIPAWPDVKAEGVVTHQGHKRANCPRKTGLQEDKLVLHVDAPAARTQGWTRPPFTSNTVPAAAPTPDASSAPPADHTPAAVDPALPPSRASNAQQEDLTPKPIPITSSLKNLEPKTSRKRRQGPVSRSPSSKHASDNSALSTPAAELSAPIKQTPSTPSSPAAPSPRAKFLVRPDETPAPELPVPAPSTSQMPSRPEPSLTSAEPLAAIAEEIQAMTAPFIQSTTPVALFPTRTSQERKLEEQIERFFEKLNVDTIMAPLYEEVCDSEMVESLLYRPERRHFFDQHSLLEIDHSTRIPQHGD